MDGRTRKQLIIGLIFVLAIGGIGYGLIDQFFLTESTCFDNIQNGQEEGVDCGILVCGKVCEPAILPLNVLYQKLIEVGSGDYDFVAQVYNPNPLFAASRVKYELNIAGKGIGSLQKAGTFYVLPGQTRYIIVPNIRNNDKLTDSTFEIKEIDWGKFQSFEGISFPVQRKNYTVVNKNGTFSELEAIVLNSSDFDFDKVEVGVILFSNGNNIVAINKTDIRTFLSRTERYFKVSWPVGLPANVARQDVEVVTNVFENSNFIKRYGTQERFQKYY